MILIKYGGPAYIAHILLWGTNNYVNVASLGHANIVRNILHVYK